MTGEGHPARHGDGPDLAATKRWRLSYSNCILYGVCGGVGTYRGIDPTWLRLAYALLTFILAIFRGIIISFLLAWIVPEEESVPDRR